ncbi:MAG: zinc ribbon domain-containing protein [Pseudomonadota bacterium]
MPIYEYDCGKCGNRFENLARSADDKAAPACPKCGSKETRKMVSGFSSCGGCGSSAPALEAKAPRHFG